LFFSHFECLFSLFDRFGLGNGRDGMDGLGMTGFLCAYLEGITPVLGLGLGPGLGNGISNRDWEPGNWDSGLGDIGVIVLFISWRNGGIGMDWAKPGLTWNRTDSGWVCPPGLGYGGIEAGSDQLR
jgi:hypothetical protein